MTFVALGFLLPLGVRRHLILISYKTLKSRRGVHYTEIPCLVSSMPASACKQYINILYMYCFIYIVRKLYIYCCLEEAQQLLQSKCLAWSLYCLLMLLSKPTSDYQQAYHSISYHTRQCNDISKFEEKSLHCIFS